MSKKKNENLFLKTKTNKGNKNQLDPKRIDILKKETPTIWKWYFGLHPRLFLTVPTFLSGVNF